MATRLRPASPTDIDALPQAAREQEPAALHHLRQRRRRQEHADRPPAVRIEDAVRGPARRASRPTPRSGARRAARSTSRCWSTAWPPSASRASPSTSPTATSRTDRRKFIVADTPGHEQYTRNMVTGASTADLAVILIDARKGVLTQTRRHSYLVSPDRHPQRRAGGQQDGPGRTTSQEVFDAHRRRVPRVRRAARPRRDHADSAVGARGRQHARAQRRARPGTTGRRCWATSKRSTSTRRDQHAGRSACRCNGSTGPNLDFRGFCRHASPAASIRPGDASACSRRAARARSRASSPPTATCRWPWPASRSR